MRNIPEGSGEVTFAYTIHKQNDLRYVELEKARRALPLSNLTYRLKFWIFGRVNWPELQNLWPFCGFRHLLSCNGVRDWKKWNTAKLVVFALCFDSGIFEALLRKTPPPAKAVHLYSLRVLFSTDYSSFRKKIASLSNLPRKRNWPHLKNIFQCVIVGGWCVCDNNRRLKRILVFYLTSW